MKSRGSHNKIKWKQKGVGCAYVLNAIYTGKSLTDKKFIINFKTAI